MTGVLAAWKQGLQPRADRTRLSPARAPDRGVRLGRGLLRPHGAREEVLTLVGPWWGLGPGLDTPTGPARPAWTRELWGETGRAEPGEGGAAAWPVCGPVLGSVLAAPSHSGNLGESRCTRRTSASPRAPEAHRPAAAQGAREQELCPELATPRPAHGARRGAPGGRGRRGRPARRTTQRAAPSSLLPQPVGGSPRAPLRAPARLTSGWGLPRTGIGCQRQGGGGRGDPSSPGSQLGQRAPRSADAAGPLPRRPLHTPADLRAGGRRGGGDSCGGGPHAAMFDSSQYPYNCFNYDADDYPAGSSDEEKRLTRPAYR